MKATTKHDALIQPILPLTSAIGCKRIYFCCGDSYGQLVAHCDNCAAHWPANLDFCPVCGPEYPIESKARDARRASARQSRLRIEYGMSLGEYVTMSMNQAFRCAACSELPSNGERLVVDHDHETGKVRALLCNKCNVAEGFLRTSERARLLAAYMERHGN